MILLMFSMASRICRLPTACTRTAEVTLAVAMFMSFTVCSTSAEADDCLAVAWAIWAMSWLERFTDSLMRRRASPALSASWMPSRVSMAPAFAVSTASVVSA